MSGEERSAPAGTTVHTLVEIHGGAARWAAAERAFTARGWPTRDPTPRERRLARRAFGVVDADVLFRWVEIAVPGASRRASRRAGWMVAEAARRAEVVLYDRRFTHSASDRALQPAWQVYSTRHRPAAVAPAGASRRSRAVRWVRGGLHRAAVRLGVHDLANELVHGPREAALRVARELSADGPRTDVDIRPLDGLERRAEGLPGERAFQRAVVLAVSLLFTAGLLLTLARDAPLAGRVLFGVLAVGCAGVGVWYVGRLSSSVGEAVVVSLLLAALLTGATLGIPAVADGVDRGQALALLLSVYYIAGLIVLVRRWRWTGLLVGALPVLTTLAVAALPVTSTILHDAYADELGLTPAETAVSTTWQLIAAARLLWTPLLAVLAVAAGWGLLRYFHYVRGHQPLELLALALVAALAVLPAVTGTLASAQGAAQAVQRAAAERAPAPAYFGVKPDWVCPVPIVPAGELAEKGGELDPRRPHLSFGVADGHAVLWDARAGAPLRVLAEQIRLVPAGAAERTRGRCPGSAAGR